MSHAATPKAGPVLVAIGAILALYIGLVFWGWPQEATAKVTAGGHEPPPASAVGDDHVPPAAEAKPEPPPAWMMIPFAGLLLSIAVLPLIPKVSDWWGSNRNRLIVSVVLGVLTLGYYLAAHGHAVEGHFPAHYTTAPSADGASPQLAATVLSNAMLGEYVPFIVLLFALYTISGGIRISGDLVARPATNTTFMAIGAVLASVIGTTGAAMLLIRALLETNRERKHVVHTVVFFIFIVCNTGGLLLPTGDPPLFLGYLHGVPFLWTLKLAPHYLLVNGMLLTIYFFWDTFYAYPKEEKKDIVRDETRVHPLRIAGLWPNGVLLLAVIVSVAILDPNKPLPGTSWHPWVFLREVVQLALVGLSLLLGAQHVREQNKFNYHAIIEVAVLFLGIFITMQPALQLLNARGKDLGIDTPQKFFWATGVLSSVLDNAPTYLVFFETAKGLDHETKAKFLPFVPEIAGELPVAFLAAVSLGAVMMGAMTYIGNGPNFMVKAIADESGVKMPSFFGYVKYTLCVLLPVFLIMTQLCDWLGWTFY